ncbi:MAG: lipocalin family protein [Pseudomonadota bacterium]|nr:MAG: lipocalin family protein [Pseudomonadota bacterium]
MNRKHHWLAISLLALVGCSSTQHGQLATVPHVDLDRFMGDWYVIASIPTFLEKNAHNAVETYRQAADGTIATTFTFRDGSFEGEIKRYTPTGYIRDTNSNAVWGMQFVWPIKADYRIVYLDANYTLTVIGRNKRDYVWVMARTPQISDSDYANVLRLIEGLGYDVSQLQKVPQRWEGAEHDTALQQPGEHGA